MSCFVWEGGGSGFVWEGTVPGGSDLYGRARLAAVICMGGWQ